ncbi:MAG: aspartate aminotransferase, partial [Planctomycetaceae bacterium]
RRKRNRLVERLAPHFRIGGGAGAFYLFLQSPRGTGSDFVERAIRRGLLIIPGNVFSDRDTHIRVSFAVDDETLETGANLLIELAGE